MEPEPCRNFWHNQDRTGTIENLLENVSKSTFVAIDFGNYEIEAAIDVGIAILPTFPEWLLNAPLDTGVGALASKYGALIHNFSTPPEAQSPKLESTKSHTEQLLWGTEDTLPAQKIEAKLVTMLQRAQRQAELEEKDLVLVLFDANNDLKANATWFPKIEPFFARWIDVQPIICRLDASYDHRTTAERPSLGDTIKCLGHTSKIRGGVSPKFHKHKSSNDAARTLTALAGAVQKFRAGEKFHIQEARQLRRPGGAQFRTRPRPDVMYPFVAEIRMVKGQGHVSPLLCHFPREWAERTIWDVFAAFQPNAVGRNGVVRHGTSKSRHTCNEKCSGWCVWISVPTRELLGQLVEEFGEREMLDGRLMVKDVSLAAEAPMSREELVAKVRALSKAKEVDEAELPEDLEIRTRMLTMD